MYKVVLLFKVAKRRTLRYTVQLFNHQSYSSPVPSFMMFFFSRQRKEHGQLLLVFRRWDHKYVDLHMVHGLLRSVTVRYPHVLCAFLLRDYHIYYCVIIILVVYRVKVDRAEFVL